jgi:hypothetical protein
VQQQMLAAQLLEQQISRAGQAAAAAVQSPLLSLNGMPEMQKQQLCMHQQKQHRLQERNNGNQNQRNQQVHQQEQHAKQSQHSPFSARQVETTKPPQRLQH